MFMYVSQETRRPLYVAPDFNSTRRGRDVDAFRRESGSYNDNKWMCSKKKRMRCFN
jgi:hypothetical protein